MTECLLHAAVFCGELAQLLLSRIIRLRAQAPPLMTPRSILLLRRTRVLLLPPCSCRQWRLDPDSHLHSSPISSFCKEKPHHHTCVATSRPSTSDDAGSLLAFHIPQVLSSPELQLLPEHIISPSRYIRYGATLNQPPSSLNQGSNPSGKTNLYFCFSCFSVIICE